MRTPLLLADFSHARPCKPFCEKYLTLPLQPILKGLSGDTDYVADTDRLQQSEIGEFIGRAAADTENDCDVIHSVRSALGHPFFVGAHKTVSLC